MNSSKHFSFKEAYKFAMSTFIDTFGTVFGASVAWFFIAIAAVLVIILPFGLSAGYFATIFTNPTPGAIALGGALGLLFALAVLILLEAINFQFLRLAFSYDAGSPLVFNQLFSFKEHNFMAYLKARLLYYAKVFAAGLLYIIPLAVGYLYYFSTLRHHIQEYTPQQKYLGGVGFIALLFLLALPAIYLGYAYLFTGYSLVQSKHTSISEDAAYAYTITKSNILRIVGALFIGGLFIGNFMSVGTGGTVALLSLFMHPLMIFTLVNIYKQRQKALA